MKRIPLKDTERYQIERFKQGKKTERHLAWLKSRKAGVGGSDMSTILGLNSFKTPYELWLEKTGRVEPEDISDKWAIVKGNALENELRKRFRAAHPEMLVTDGTDKQFISREKPYLRASLDGILQGEDGSFGILEIKTASNRRAGDWHDEDGNLIYVFHNAEYEHGRYGGRDAQVRRVHWSKEGMPILDMQTAEELDPDYAGVTMEVGFFDAD